MIVTPVDDRLRVVTQSDHAHLSAAVLRLWHADDLPDHPRRDDLIFAAREHDNGWREHDTVPGVADDGQPIGFRHVSAADRRAIWQRGILRHRIDRPYAALLILEHACQLLAPARPRPDWQETFRAWDALRDDLLAETGVSPDTLAADYRWVAWTDTVSLALAERWREPMTAGGLTLTPVPMTAPDAADTLALEPFPLRGSTHFTLACRTVDGRAYRSTSDLALALAEARWQEVRVRLVPATGAGG